MAEWFQPRFMTSSREEYEAEKTTISSKEEWIAFRKKWFSGFPSMQAEHHAERHARRERIIPPGWNICDLEYAITQEAKYEFMTTSHRIGDPLQFPHMFENLPPYSTDGWHHTCWFDEIWTNAPGITHCPVCGRELIHEFRSNMSDD